MWISITKNFFFLFFPFLQTVSTHLRLVGSNLTSSTTTRGTDVPGEPVISGELSILPPRLWAWSCVVLPGNQDACQHVDILQIKHITNNLNVGVDIWSGIFFQLSKVSLCAKHYFFSNIKGYICTYTLNIIHS